MAPRFWPQLDPEARPTPDALVFAFSDDRLVVLPDRARMTVPKASRLASLVGLSQAIHTGRLGARACYTVALASAWSPPAPLALAGLRDLYGRLPEHLLAIAGRAYQIVEWYRGHAFCGRCGSPTEAAQGERARVCPRCQALHFPRINPAVIMLVARGPKMLLARNRQFRGGFYSALAGYVDPGETLEQAVQREVQEEVGIEVDRIRYFGSQPWPYPSQLMVAFTAHHRAGEVRIQDSELLDARWFGGGDLPELPGRFAIARWLIDDFLARHPASA